METVAQTWIKRELKILSVCEWLHWFGRYVFVGRRLNNMPKVLLPEKDIY